MSSRASAGKLARLIPGIFYEGSKMAWQPTGRPRAVCDIECFHDYFLVMFSRIAEDGTKTPFKGFEQYKGQPLDRRGIVAVLQRHTIVTFNGNNYDMCMLMYALKSVSNKDLKRASDHIIQGNLRNWQFYQEYGVEVHDSVDHIDLIEVAKGQASLKIYGGRLHSETMQDLPYHFDDHIFIDVSEEEDLSSSVRRKTTFNYCGNDLATTKDLWKALHKVIKIREMMSEQYGIDLRSKSDAQIAEAVIKARIEELTGRRVYKPNESTHNTSFRYKTPDFISFQTPDMQRVLHTVKNTLFHVRNGKVEMPESLSKMLIGLGDSRYKLGIGGLHSTESSISHHADEDHDLSEDDAKSYYPSIIIRCRLYPKHLGEVFLDVYEPIYDERQVAIGEKKETFKIILNGSFGKFGSCYSILFAPDLLIQTTITGQLCLLMLIEAFEEEGIPVVSANTDGVVTRCPKYLAATKARIIKEWEDKTGLVMESTQYKSIYSRDVNNYIAIKFDGSAKRKGAYAKPAIDKNPTASIAVEAVVEYLTKGTPVEDTIEWCQDMRQFVSIKRVNGGGVQGGETTVDDWVRWGDRHWVRQAWIDEGQSRVWLGNKAVKLVTKRPPPVAIQQDGVQLGKAVRFYYSTKSPGPIRYATNGNKVGETDGCMALMTLPKELPTDIDYDWYINRANRILREIAA